MMKLQNKIYLYISLLITASNGYSQTIDSLYSICAWRGNTKAAITYTFDDGCPNQYTKVIPMFNEYDFDATFFPIISWSPNWSSFQQAVNNGHEVGSHTVNHLHPGTLSDSLQNVELKDSQAAIDANLSGQKCQTIAYPFCEPTKSEITRKYYIAARHCQGNIEKTTPTDFWNLSSIVCGANGTIKSTDDFKTKANSAALTKGWVVYLIHGTDGDGGYSDLSTTALRGGLDYLDANRNKFWVSTFGNVVRYIRERNSVSVQEVEIYTDSILVGITDTLNNQIYNYPVSISRILPIDWPNAMAWQNGQKVNSKVETTGNEKYVIFDAIPDTGNVTIIKDTTALISGIHGFKRDPQEINVWQDHTTLHFTLPASYGKSLNADLYDINGVTVARSENIDEESVSGKINLTGKNQLKTGVFILQITDGTDLWVRKVILL
jgi:peptidoglycan/xylan/chitin deacetylase (PgdA/CDA1 family)